MPVLAAPAPYGGTGVTPQPSASTTLSPMLAAPGASPPLAAMTSTQSGMGATSSAFSAPSTSSSALSVMQPPPGPPPSLSPMQPYKAATDKTLTSKQAKSGGFQPVGTQKVVNAKPIDEGEFRVSSNPTTSGHSSGYHESFAPTDTMRFLSNRKPNNDGTATLPPWNSPTVLPSYSGTKIIESNVKPVAEASDGARTDTARTILSVPNGGAAGHTGSSVKTTGQPAAHNVLRHQVMRTLQEPGVTSGVAGVLAGATTIMSMAPGTIASTAKNANQLKDRQARTQHETNRNDAKRKLDEHYEGLSPSEQAIVMKIAKQGMTDLNDNSRTLLPDRPHSPLRDPIGTPGAPISGGGYLSAVTTPAPPSTTFPVLPTSASAPVTSMSLTSPTTMPPVPTPQHPGNSFAPVVGTAHHAPLPSSASSTTPHGSATSAPPTASTTAAPVTTTATTPAAHTGVGAREIAMDITQSFRADRK